MVRRNSGPGQPEEDEGRSCRGGPCLRREPADLFADLGAGTVVILSTISRLVSRSWLLASGSTTSRNSGASVGSVVMAHTVTDVVASKRSSWTMTTGRGFPT